MSIYTKCSLSEIAVIIIGFSGTIYKVDFDKFTISDGITDSPVRRLFTTSSVNDSASFHTFTTKWCWYWKNNSKKFEKFHLQVYDIHISYNAVFTFTKYKKKLCGIFLQSLNDI